MHRAGRCKIDCKLGLVLLPRLSCSFSRNLCLQTNHRYLRKPARTKTHIARLLQSHRHGSGPAPSFLPH